MPEEALTSFTVPYLTHVASLQVRQLLKSESRSRIEYIIQTNNIIVLDSYFNLTNNLMSLTGFNTI